LLRYFCSKESAITGEAALSFSTPRPLKFRRRRQLRRACATIERLEERRLLAYLNWTGAGNDDYWSTADRRNRPKTATS
jgi:hypothetical protein